MNSAFICSAPLYWRWKVNRRRHYGFTWRRGSDDGPLAEEAAAPTLSGSLCRYGLNRHIPNGGAYATGPSEEMVPVSIHNHEVFCQLPSASVSTYHLQLISADQLMGVNSAHS